LSCGWILRLDPATGRRSGRVLRRNLRV